MKHSILLFVFVFFFSILFSQNQEGTQSDIVKGKKSGEIVKGKNVAYKIVKGDVYYEIKNTIIPDSLRRFDSYDGELGPKKLREQIEQIVYKHIKAEDLRFPYFEHDNLWVCFILNKHLKIEKLTFLLPHDGVDFWINLPVDRFYEMEKEMMEMEPILSEQDKEGMKEMDFENGAFYSAIIPYKYLYETLKAIESVKKK